MTEWLFLAINMMAPASGILLAGFKSTHEYRIYFGILRWTFRPHWDYVVRCISVNGNRVQIYKIAMYNL